MAKASSNDADMLFNYDIHVASRRIVLSGAVGVSMYRTLSSGLILLDNKEKDITIELNSEGGDWDAGAAIFDLIRDCGSKVTIKVVGCAMSMGSIILQAGDTRLVGKHSTIMVHDGDDSMSGTPDTMLAWAKYGVVRCEQMYEIYAEASGKSVKFWREKCKKDFILTAKQAIELGLADGFI